MKGLFIVDCDLVAGVDVAESKEENVPIDGADIGIRFAGVINVMRAVAATTAVDAPHPVNIADAQLSSMGAALRLAIGNSLPRVLGYLAAAGKEVCSKAAFAVDL